jgi:hypothetical protein
MAINSGFDPLDLPFDRFCNWVYTWIMRDRNEVQKASVIAQLYLPIVGLDEDNSSAGPWSDEAMAKSFIATKGRVDAGELK